MDVEIGCCMILTYLCMFSDMNKHGCWCLTVCSIAGDAHRPMAASQEVIETSNRHAMLCNCRIDVKEVSDYQAICGYWTWQHTTCFPYLWTMWINIKPTVGCFTVWSCVVLPRSQIHQVVDGWNDVRQDVHQQTGQCQQNGCHHADHWVPVGEALRNLPDGLSWLV